MTPGADPDASRVAGATTPGPTGAAVRRLDSLPASVSAPAGSMSPKPSARLYPPAGWSRADCASARATSAGGRAGWADLMKAAVAVSHASAAKKLYTGNVPPAGPDANRVLPGADTRRTHRRRRANCCEPADGAGPVRRMTLYTSGTTDTAECEEWENRAE